MVRRPHHEARYLCAVGERSKEFLRFGFFAECCVTAVGPADQ